MNTIVAVSIACITILTVAEQRPAQTEQGFSYQDYSAVLSAHVDDEGLVNYTALSNDRGRLDAFAAAVGELNVTTYESWNESAKIAFWINSYNALTLQLIAAHYPIGSSRHTSPEYPKNSVRQIPGAWEKIMFEVMGKPITLDSIEHDVLRGQFDEPRIHMALVCAAVSCPPLRDEPYESAGLDDQLDDQTKKFLETDENFRIDRVAGVVRLSMIFDWFGGDFVGLDGSGGRQWKHGESAKAVIDFISGYVDEADREFLQSGDYRIEYTEYDWTLNEQK